MPNRSRFLDLHDAEKDGDLPMSVRVRDASEKQQRSTTRRRIGGRKKKKKGKENPEKGKMAPMILSRSAQTDMARRRSFSSNTFLPFRLL